MKKLVLALVCASSLAYGQQIPNGDFEDWGTSPESFIPVPTGYTGVGFSDTAIAKVPGYQSSAAVRLTNVDFLTQDTIPSLLTGYFGLQNTPTKISGYYRSALKGVDSASVLLILGDKTKALEQDDASAFAYIAFGGFHPNWTYFEAPITILTNDPIDTGGVILSSDGIIYGNPDLHEVIQPGSYIEFDKLSLSYSPLSLMGNNRRPSTLTLYPNPASQSVVLENVEGLQDYTLQDLSGAVVLKGELHQGNNTLTLGSVAPGTYILVSKSSSRTFSSKLVVK